MALGVNQPETPVAEAGGQDVPSSNLPTKPGRVSLEKFVKALHDKGIDDPEVRDMVARMSYMQLAAIRDHDGFQQLLDGIVLKSLIVDNEISKQRQWALNYLKKDSKSRLRTRFGGKIRKQESIDIQAEVG